MTDDELVAATFAASPHGEDLRRQLAEHGVAQPPEGATPIPFVDAFPGTPDKKIHFVPVELEREAGGLYTYRSDPRTHEFPLALISLVAAGVFQMLFLASTNTLLQLIVPDELRGRVMSLYMLDRGFMPAGALFAGVTAHFIGAPSTVATMGAIVIILAMIVAWRVPAIRALES